MSGTKDAINYIDRCISESIEEGEAPKDTNGFHVSVNCYMLRKVLQLLAGEKPTVYTQKRGWE